MGSCANNYIFAGIRYQSVWRRSILEILSINKISKNIPSSYSLNQIYPNPFNNAFAINYNIPKGSKMGVFELRDVMGYLIYSTPLTINVNQLQVVASSLKPGVYFASLIVDGGLVKTEKVVKN